jgi:hypothetical protein
MTTLTFDVEEFRAQFPAFADVTTYPDLTLEAYWDAAILYISPNVGCRMTAAQRLRALYLLTAHLTVISTRAANGSKNTYIMQSSAIDKVSVSVVPPPLRDEWGFWLSSTPYGLQLLALLTAASMGGMIIGGLPESSGFRKVGGIF